MTPNESEEPSELAIQSADSLLFSQAESVERAIQWQADMNDSLVVAYMFVDPMSSFETIRSYSAGTLIHLSLDKNLLVTARIYRNQPIGEHTRSITATVQTPNDGNVTLSVDQDRMTGIVNLYTLDRLFYIRYDLATNHHYIAEIDRDRLDIQEGSPPLQMN